MKTIAYRYIVPLLLTLTLALPASAQDTSLLERMYSKVSGVCLELTYSYTARMYGTKAVGSGVLASQGACWQMMGNGFEMWCDAKTVWVADPAAKEVVIEDASTDRNDYMANPALLFVNLSETFKVQTARPVDDGRAMLYVLVPSVGCDIEYCNMEIRKSDASITQGSFIMTDGNVIDITVSAMRLLPVRPVADFRPSISFDSSWIVTDLR